MVVGNSTVLICEPRRDLNSWLRLNRFSAICSLGSSARTWALLVSIMYITDRSRIELCQNCRR